MFCGVQSAKLSPQKNLVCNYLLYQITKKNFKIFKFAKCSEFGGLREFWYYLSIFAVHKDKPKSSPKSHLLI